MKQICGALLRKDSELSKVDVCSISNGKSPAPLLEKQKRPFSVQAILNSFIACLFRQAVIPGINLLQCTIEVLTVFNVPSRLQTCLQTAKGKGLTHSMNTERNLQTYFCKGFKKVKRWRKVRSILNLFSHEMLECHCELPQALFLIFGEFINIFFVKRIKSMITKWTSWIIFRCAMTAIKQDLS